MVKRKKTVQRPREESYKQTLRGVQSELNAPTKFFSKIIHQPIIEALSEVIGSTIARPYPILFGAIAACVIVPITYWLAKYNGFTLSGFETIGSFAIGWVVGLLYDIIRLILAKRTSS